MRNLALESYVKDMLPLDVDRTVCLKVLGYTQIPAPDSEFYMMSKWMEIPDGETLFCMAWNATTRTEYIRVFNNLGYKSFSPSTSMGDCWEIIKKVEKKFPDWIIDVTKSPLEKEWECFFINYVSPGSDENDFVVGKGETLLMAICRAGLILFLPLKDN